MASFLQYMLPGAPSLYYGDEAGMEGGKDPFNRRPYPWGQEDPELLEHYQILGRLRKEQEVLRTGALEFFQADHQQLGIIRRSNNKTLRIYVNRSGDVWQIPAGPVLYARNLQAIAPDWLSLSPMGFCITEDV